MAKNYDQKRIEEAARQRKKTRSGQDIGPPPAIVDPGRREEGEGSLRRFAELYFPQRFSLAWSPDHLQVLARMEEAICYGGLFALAMMRGGGKTALSEVGCLWATMTGRHQFVMLLPVSDTRAKELLDGIKTELLTNDLLFEDYPEICFPIRELEDRANKSKGQHIGGLPTYIGWHQREIILPVVAGSKASGAVLRVAGITSGSVRGAKHVRPMDGRNVRPTLAILDDPQNDVIAKSPYQVQTRHRLIHGAVLGMAGPGKKITAICPCTVIQKGDLADRLLDRKQSPLWTGQRYRMLNRWPDRMDLWQEYAERRGEEVQNGGDGHLATAFYGQNKEVMDAGAIVSWPERFNPDELGAVQHAMNLHYLDRASFASEYQNEPLLDETETDQLQAGEIVKRLNGLARGVVPLYCSHVVAFADVQHRLLYWLVAGFGDDFTGAVLDYGTFPDQKRAHFSLADAQRTLGRAYPGKGLEGSIYAGLTDLADHLLAREWKREDGAALKVERMLVDAGAQTDTVKLWCRQTPYSGVVMPSHGRGIGVKAKPMSAYIKHPGERFGFHWIVSAASGRQATRHLLIDTYFYKSMVADRLKRGIGDKGSLTLFGKPGTDHRLLADHLTAEYSKLVSTDERKITEWIWKPERHDNHWFDCLVGAMAAASLQGCQVAAAQATAEPGRKAYSFRDAQERRRG